MPISAQTPSNSSLPPPTGNASIWVALAVETLLTFAFIFAVLGVTEKTENKLAIGITTGLALTMVHLLGIRLTGTSVNANRYYVASVVLLLLVNIFLIDPIVLMVFQKREVNLGSVSAISVAAYTTVKIILAVKNYRKTAKQTVRQAYTRRAVNLVDAIVSLLTLQNTLIATNGSATSNEMRLLSAVSGVIAFVLIMIISAESFVHIKKTLKND